MRAIKVSWFFFTGLTLLSLSCAASPGDSATSVVIATNAQPPLTNSTALDAETNSNSAAPKPQFDVSSKLETVRTLPPALQVFVDLGKRRLGFRAPPGYRLDGQDDGQLKLANQNSDSFITCRLTGPVPKSGENLDEYCEKLLFERFPGAAIGLRTIAVSGDGLRGTQFDFKWLGFGNQQQSSRVAYIPCAAGLLEFALITSPSKFDLATDDFYTVLMTLRVSDENGRLDIPVRSSKL